MAKRKNHPVTGTAKIRASEPPRSEARAQAEATPELEDEVAAALDSGHPFDIVMLASSLIAGLDPDAGRPARTRPGAAAARGVRPDVPRLERPPAAVLAWTVARLLPDSGCTTRSTAALEPGAVPAWLLPLARRGGRRLADHRPVAGLVRRGVSLRVGEHDLTVVGLVDLNSDGALKDGFVVPAPLSAFQEALPRER